MPAVIITTICVEARMGRTKKNAPEIEPVSLPDLDPIGNNSDGAGA